MKITAILPDDLVLELRHQSQAKTITESLIVALNEWVELRKLKKLNEKIRKKPLKFSPGFSAEKIRRINRA